jgi:hypothetical protein
MSDYPEHDKMAAMRTELDAVAGFLEALEAGELTYDRARLRLAVYSGETSTRTQIVGANIPSLLAQWSGIDQDKIEAEKRAMLERCREAAKADR